MIYSLAPWGFLINVLEFMGSDDKAIAAKIFKKRFSFIIIKYPC